VAFELAVLSLAAGPKIVFAPHVTPLEVIFPSMVSTGITLFFSVGGEELKVFA
jgi:hypothetical protein